MGDRVKQNADVFEKEAARRWLNRVVDRERDVLMAHAFASGVEAKAVTVEDGKIVGWWPELAPLKKDEAEEVRQMVAAELVEKEGEGA